jgi:hypothetical protein
MENLEFVIIRTDSAGVHMGYLKEEQVANSGHFAVTLVNTRRIWSWAGANSLSELAALGSSKPSDCKISIAVLKNKMMAIEIISVTEKAKKNLESIPDWVFK